MEFLKFVRSVEEFLYELMSWLIFYPRTLWRALVSPIRLTLEAENEMRRDDDQRFVGLISPPLFLVLSVVVAWIIQSALHLKVDVPVQGEGLGQVVLASPSNLLAYRVMSFSIFPLVMAVGLLGLRRQAIDRLTLRRPFYLQCFLAGPFSLATSMVVDLQRIAQPQLAVALAAAALVWFLGVETVWFEQQLETSRGKAFMIAAGFFLLAVIVLFTLVFVLFVPGVAAR